ncbi:uncharacterized protein LOC105840373 isoform X2 [Monomorium pharaonis]|uniref:uncharacterized protein LOC105840373 isoform X2 n=1 Tax=Monomorium pharaonis TaxID=307658 RepID=UPI00063F9C39|nr:uncharacterized protein LOC105840373 isoform X2 [Monomorium pharaonis]
MTKKTILVSLYRPPDARMNELKWTQFLELISGLSVNHGIIICGDFNAQNEVWGSSIASSAGKVLAKIIDDSPLCILNDGSQTKLSANDNYISVPDISLASVDFCSTLSWEVCDDTIEYQSAGDSYRL